MKKIKFALILLVIIFFACKKNSNPDTPQTHEIDAAVSQFSCTDFYYYRINVSSAALTEVDFGDGSPIIALSSNVGYHQYMHTGSFNLSFKQTFSDGQVIEKKIPINITQLCNFKRILSTNSPKANIVTSSDPASFEFGGNVYFQDANNVRNYIYNIASNRFIRTANWGNGVSHIYDGTYLYHILGGGGTFTSLWKHTFDSMPTGGVSTSIPVNIPMRYRNLEIAVNGKLYYGFGGIIGSSINDNKLSAIDCTTGTRTLISTPYGNNATITVGGQAYYNNKIYIFASVSGAGTSLDGHKVIIFDPVTNIFTSLTANIGAFMIGPSSSNKAKVINNFAFMRSTNENIVVYDFNTNSFLNKCELSNMKGLNFAANNKYYSLNPVYYNNPYVYQNSDELWEYQP